MRVSQHPQTAWVIIPWSRSEPDVQPKGGQVLTVAYCRVSTEEQAEEGFSIEGQVDKPTAPPCFLNGALRGSRTDPHLL